MCPHSTRGGTRDQEGKELFEWFWSALLAADFCSIAAALTRLHVPSEREVTYTGSELLPLSLLNT